MIAAYLMRGHHDLVTANVWVRGIIVAATSLLMYSFAVWAAKGSARALLRLRITATAMVGVIAVIVALPGFLPTWMRIEQSACGLLLLGVAALLFTRRTRRFDGQDVD
ncbi:hypothetical protein [Mangrovactinospora gilvigrisea]|uniref:hypothetical protein n=1 Tax=Mangrovactinospora gilvigrisea TaxID=1428644 RepID=UPI000AA046B2|nr:hypothetical protein [Mangrovactinospora gilvigrisea]